MGTQTFVRQNQPPQEVEVEIAAKEFLDALADEDPYIDAETSNLGVAYHVAEQHWSFADATAFVRRTWQVESANQLTDAVLDTFSASLNVTIDTEAERLSFAVLDQEPFMVVAFR